MWKQIVLSGFVVCLCVLCGCGSQGNIAIVKGGTLSFDNTVMVGDAFDNYKYFKKGTWSELTTENNREIVQFEGLLDLDNLPTGEIFKSQGITEMVFVIQFAVGKDRKSFKLSAGGMKVKSADGTKQINSPMNQVMKSIKDVYNNQPFS